MKRQQEPSSPALAHTSDVAHEPAPGSTDGNLILRGRAVIDPPAAHNLTVRGVTVIDRAQRTFSHYVEARGCTVIDHRDAPQR